MEANKQINCLVYLIFRDQDFMLESLRKKHGIKYYEEMIGENVLDLRTGEPTCPEEEDPKDWKHLLPYEVRHCDLAADFFVDDLWEAIRYENNNADEAVALIRELAKYAHEFMSGKHNAFGRKSIDFGEYLAFNVGGASSYNGDSVEYDTWATFLGIADITNGTYMDFKTYIKKEKEKNKWI